MGRKERDPSRGSPRFLTAQRTLVRNDNQITQLLFPVTSLTEGQQFV